MGRNDDNESLPAYQLRVLWEDREADKLRMLWDERESRLKSIQQDKGLSLKSLIATPERAGLTILFAAQAMGFGPEVLSALAKILGVK